MSKILDNLFLGSYQDAKNEKFLKKNGITHIVTVGVELQALFPKLFKYLYVPAYDSPGYKLSVYFDQIADFIHNAIENEKGKVFVHCYMGISRSTTSILAYLIKHLKWPLLKARNFVQSKRPIVYPNDGFIRQLTSFAKRHGILDDTGSVRSSKMSVTLPRFFGATKPEEESKLSDLQSAMHVTGMKTNSFAEAKTTINSFLNMATGANQDYHCKNCGIKLYNNLDIVHEGEKKTGSKCTSTYLKYMSWMGYSRTNSAKLFCPNVKCGSILGYTNKNGGKCSCGKPIENMCVVYPLRVVSSKGKAQTSSVKAQTFSAKAPALSAKGW